MESLSQVEMSLEKCAPALMEMREGALRKLSEAGGALPVVSNKKTVETQCPEDGEDVQLLVKAGISLLQDGRGNEEEKKTACRLFAEAQRLGSMDAVALLARCYSSGWGIEQDQVRAVAMAQESAAAGSAWGCFVLGNRYRTGTGVAKNEAESVRLFELAANRGLVPALYNLGVAFFRGQGVKEDTIKALELYHVAAERGLAVAQYNLGIRYQIGAAVPRNEKFATSLLFSAADQNFPAAQRKLGTQYSDEPWRLVRHASFGPSGVLFLSTVLLCAQRANQTLSLPSLPVELWLVIFESLTRRDFLLCV